MSTARIQVSFRVHFLSPPPLVSLNLSFKNLLTEIFKIWVFFVFLFFVFKFSWVLVEENRPTMFAEGNDWLIQVGQIQRDRIWE